ncbi:mercury methylation ferredoxin HgcB [Desulfococcaceae bacterium HSG8]|nr:mercury methylation ferredoxin HgcB [Desulfococcaceae bacterium HSG8]
MGQFIYLKNVVTLELDEEKCVGCGMCLIVCPHAVLSMNEKHARIENRDACMECGACAKNCPADAVTVQAGVGCAAAVINTALGRKDSSCCCVIEPARTSCNDSRQSEKAGCPIL